MASFLRPTAASWKRTHKDPDAAAAAGASAKPPSSSGSRTGPVRAMGGMVRTAGAPAAASRATGPKVVVGRGGAAVESTEERELRLAQEARERLRKVCFCVCEKDDLMAQKVLILSYFLLNIHINLPTASPREPPGLRAEPRRGVLHRRRPLTLH
jgi:hypothetical protein